MKKKYSLFFSGGFEILGSRMKKFLLEDNKVVQEDTRQPALRYLPTFLPSYLPTFLPSYLPTFLPSLLYSDY